MAEIHSSWQSLPHVHLGIHEKEIITTAPEKAEIWHCIHSVVLTAEEKHVCCAERRNLSVGLAMRAKKHLLRNDYLVKSARLSVLGPRL